MSRPASDARRALLYAIRSGITGTYEALAAVAGVEPDKAREILKEISRAGHSRALVRQRIAGRPGAHRAVHAAPTEAPCDALALVRQAWR